ncbi:DUF3027 domain-containing protein [Microbacterium karelineae]|uniref:DUF3027 domain-containing protein n=1 Tax=Microbacterium karelineae TaxID=2654283 RepID=UPI0012EA1A17|nr:DUF3027 domain-containing protein [Microbacterium karelineae]
MTSTADTDERLLASRDLALDALREITPEETIGEPAAHSVTDGVVSLRFNTALLGYPGWFWTVSLAAVDGEDPTVLEVELLPGDGALLAPDWIPWSQRLEDYKAHQAAAKAEEEAAREDDDEDDDLDEDDVHDDGSSILHAGDVDGVDIDELDEDEDGDSDDDDDEDSDGDEAGDA